MYYKRRKQTLNKFLRYAEKKGLTILIGEKVTDSSYTALGWLIEQYLESLKNET